MKVRFKIQTKLVAKHETVMREIKSWHILRQTLYKLQQPGGSKIDALTLTYQTNAVITVLFSNST